MEGWRKYREIFPRSLVHLYKSPLRVVFPHTNSEVEFRSTHGNAYENWRAAGLNGAVFDEAGTIPEDAVLTLEPMLTDDPTSSLIAAGSPRGRNWFYNRWLLGHDKNSGWWSNPETWPSLLRPSFSQSEWDRMKQTYPTMWFRQEFMAEFLSNVLGAFKNPVDADFEYVSFGELSVISRNETLFIGIDFARTTDWTVIAVIDQTGKVLYKERFQLKPWPYVVQRCKAVWQACNRTKMAIDATGLGDVVYAMLLEAGIEANKIIPFVFTQDTKAELVVTGQKLNEESKLQVPKSDTYGCSEFDSFEVDVNANGKFKFNAPSGKFDDFVIAVLLAAWLMVGENRFDIGTFKFFEPAVA